MVPVGIEAMNFFGGSAYLDVMQLAQHRNLDNDRNERYQLSMEEYDALLMGSGAVRFGTRNVKSDFELIPGILNSFRGRERLFLAEIKEFHREYRWVS